QVAGYGRHAILFIILSFTVTLAEIGLAGDILINAPDWVMFYLFMIVFALYNWGMSHAWKMVKVARHLREHKNEPEINDPLRSQLIREAKLERSDDK
ncbi:MAG: hypothetical protein PHF31_10910, partial [Methylobacter sp.]|nr:hypothetical protein [Methylobacter sp.]